jgi:hypothetical protein
MGKSYAIRLMLGRAASGSVDIQFAAAAVVVGVHRCLLVVVQAEVFVKRGFLSAGHDAGGQVGVALG